MNTTPRRKDRTISRERAEEILERGEYGFLSLVSDDEYPYGLPINYVKDGDRLYMHCAPDGRKMDCIMRSPNAMFCVVGNADIRPRQFSLNYSSAMAFGKISVCNEAEKIAALKLIAKRFCPQFESQADAYIAKSASRTAVLRFDIEAISGKAKDIPQE